MTGKEQENPVSADQATKGETPPVGCPRLAIPTATPSEPWASLAHDLWWAEASIWTDRMVSALGNGVKGGKWFSLIDKVIRPATLDLAWQRVARNNGAAGVDGQSVERFSHRADRYLMELQGNLANGSYSRTRSNGWRYPKRTARLVRWGYRQ
jgi:hypothetical protein